MKDLSIDLQQRREAALYRRRRVVETPCAVEMRVDGRDCLSFCSNDYLGLANHPDLIAALKKGADQWGVGSGSAHLVVGHSAAHHALEEELAAFVGRERVLLFSTGYMANLAITSALAGRSTRLFQDRLNHASLLDAARISGSRLIRYRHGDMADLDKRMQDADAEDACVLSDGVFSMDGDLAPLPEMVRIAAAHQADVMVDDAHAIGVLGATGAGTLEHYGLDDKQVPILMATLGKAFGVAGAFVAGSEALIETLIQQARSYIYTTAMPAAMAEATRVSLRKVQQDQWRREQLAELVAYFRQGAAQRGLSLMTSMTPIQPLLLGSSERALAWSDALLDQGILVPAIRPPTVAEGQARLRLTFSASHQMTQVERLLDALEKISLAEGAA
ncbi:MAG: 8-amino-7-oxononanoate synthase [Gammaproteobacteria bacterium]|nr:8-amino-7-oxononanoate synthase [Gammaproteobacteria bacterium]